MAGTSSKGAAREAVKKAFTSLKENVTDTKSASEILKEFIDKLIHLKNTVKKEGKKETVMGKYLKGYEIKDASKSPISKAVQEFLSGSAEIFKHNAYVNDGSINKDIDKIGEDVAKKLGKCKKLKSADVLAAMYHVLDKTEINPVLRLLILGEMFTELGKANGFIKGNQQGAPDDEEDEQDENNERKDNANKHLGTLATKELRSLGAAIGKKINDLFGNANWLKKEENTVNNCTVAPKAENSSTREEPKSDRAKAIEMQQDFNIRRKYLKQGSKKVNALPEDLQPRDKADGKYRLREMANDEQLEAFLRNPGSVIRLRDLKSCTEDKDQFKKALDKKYNINSVYVSLRAILNKIADIVYKNNSLIEVVGKLPSTAEDLDSLLTLVETKLKRSRAKNNRRVEINNELKDWITVINVVNACEKTFEVDYRPETEYDDLLQDVVAHLKGITIQVVNGDDGKLEDKTIDDVIGIELAKMNLIELKAEHIKRMKSLNIAYDETKKYTEMYGKIQNLIKQPTEETLRTAGIKIVTQNDGQTITKKNWTDSKAYDDFVKGKGNAISKIAEKKGNQPPLPPVDGTARDARLVLSDAKDAYAKFKADAEWFDDPSKDNCATAIENLTEEIYLGEHIDLLKALKGTNDREYVLGIKLNSFVDSWVKLAKEKLGETDLTKDTNYVETAEETDMLATANGLKICAKIGKPESGYTDVEVNAFVDFVAKNSNADFYEVEGIKDTAWGNLMTGKWSLLVTADPKNQVLTVNDGKFKLEDKKQPDPADQQQPTQQ